MSRLRRAVAGDDGSVTVEAALGIASIVLVVALAAAAAGAALLQVRLVDAAREAARVSARDGERDRGRDGVGRKRKADEVDLEDGYASKKERVAAASRRAPWARDVDWDGCSNVAELYVPSTHFLLKRPARAL